MLLLYIKEQNLGYLNIKDYRLVVLPQPEMRKLPDFAKATLVHNSD
jgi:hypothetical protein